MAEYDIVDIAIASPNMVEASLIEKVAAAVNKDQGEYPVTSCNDGLPAWAYHRIGFCDTQCNTPFTSTILAMGRVCSQYLSFQFWRKFAIWWKSPSHCLPHFVLQFLQRLYYTSSTKTRIETWLQSSLISRASFDGFGDGLPPDWLFQLPGNPDRFPKEQTIVIIFAGHD